MPTNDRFLLAWPRWLLDMLSWRVWGPPNPHCPTTPHLSYLSFLCVGFGDFLENPPCPVLCQVMSWCSTSSQTHAKIFNWLYEKQVSSPKSCWVVMCKQVLKQQRGLGEENDHGDTVMLSVGLGRWFTCDRNRMAFHSGSELSGRKLYQYQGPHGISHHYLSLTLTQTHCPAHLLPRKGLDQMLKTSKKKRNNPILFQCAVYAM